MRSPRFFASVAIVFWGVSFVATKAVLAHVSPVTLIFTRFLIGSIALLRIARRLPRERRSRRPVGKIAREGGVLPDRSQEEGRGRQELLAHNDLLRRGTPPVELKTDAAVYEAVRKERGAIGYVTGDAPLGPGVHAITVK